MPTKKAGSGKKAGKAGGAGKGRIFRCGVCGATFDDYIQGEAHTIKCAKAKEAALAEQARAKAAKEELNQEYRNNMPRAARNAANPEGQPRPSGRR